MDPKARTAVIIVAVIVLFVSAVIGGYLYWLQRNRSSLLQARKDGQALAKTTDDNGCWQAAIARQKVAKGVTDSVLNQSFLLACLAEANNPPGFCDGVPMPGELIDSASWAKERCGKLDLKTGDCESLLRTLQTYCSEFPKK